MIDRSEIREVLTAAFEAVQVVGETYENDTWRKADKVFEVFRAGECADTVQHGGFSIRVGGAVQQANREKQRAEHGLMLTSTVRVAFSLRIRDTDQDVSENEILEAGTDLLKAAVSVQQTTGLRITAADAPFLEAAKKQNYLVGELVLHASHRQPLE